MFVLEAMLAIAFRRNKSIDRKKNHDIQLCVILLTSTTPH